MSKKILWNAFQIVLFVFTIHHSRKFTEENKRWCYSLGLSWGWAVTEPSNMLQCDSLEFPQVLSSAISSSLPTCSPCVILCTAFTSTSTCWWIQIYNLISWFPKLFFKGNMGAPSQFHNQPVPNWTLIFSQYYSLSWLMAITVQSAILAKNLWVSNDFFLTFIQWTAKPVNSETLKNLSKLPPPLYYRCFSLGLYHL